jgi:hypothetical protein
VHRVCVSCCVWLFECSRVGLLLPVSYSDLRSLYEHLSKSHANEHAKGAKRKILMAYVHVHSYCAACIAGQVVEGIHTLEVDAPGFYFEPIKLDVHYRSS